MQREIVKLLLLDRAGPVVPRFDKAIQRVNRTIQRIRVLRQNKLRYPFDSYLSGGQRYPPSEQPRPGQVGDNFDFSFVVFP